MTRKRERPGRRGWAGRAGRVLGLVLVVGLAAAMAGEGVALAQAPMQAQDKAMEKPRVAVLALEGRDAVQEAEATAEELRQAFVNSGRYIVVDRTLTTKITEEWSTQQSGLTDQERALKVGRLYNVQMIVTGKLNRFASGGWQISAVLIDAQNGVTRKAATVRHRGDFFTLLDTQVPLLAQRLLSGGGLVTGPAPLPRVPTPVPVPAAPQGLRLQGVATRKADLPEGRSEHAAVMAGGQVWVFGGESGKNQPMDTVVRYDPGADRWFPAGHLLVPRTGAGAAELGGRIYLVGGMGTSGVLDRVDIFDPATGSWAQGPNLLQARVGAVVGAVGGRLVVAGGLDHDEQPVDRVEVLDPGAAVWRQGASMPNPRAFAAGAVAGGRLYVLGGSRSSRGGLAYVDSYDPGNDAWLPVPNLRSSRGRPAAAAAGDGIYLFGGRSGTIFFASPNGQIERFDIKGGQWEEVSNLKAGVFGHTATLVGDRVYLVGGQPSAQAQVVYEIR